MADYQLSKTGAEIDAALALAVEHETSKADVDGNYPDLTAGEAIHSTFSDFASQIETDREIDDAEEACPPIVIGTVGGNAEVQSGLMKFPELRGNTIKWNQLVQNGNFGGTTGWSGNSATISVSDNVLTAVQTDVASFFGIITAIASIPNTHKILVSFEAKADEATNIRIRYPASISQQSLTTSFKRFGFFANSGNTGFPNDGQLYLQVINTSSINTAYFKHVQLFDLTDIYGAGNEPETLSEFVRNFPLPYYDYNAGTLLSSKSGALKSIGRNQWDEEWEVGTINETTGEEETASDRIRSKNFIIVLPDTVYFANCGGDYYLYPYFYDAQRNFLSASSVKNNTFTVPSNAVWMRFVMQDTYGTTYNNDICIYINWDTPNLPYVKYQSQEVELPNIELRSAGSAYDVLYQQGGGKRRIGVVDLGTIEWSTATIGGDDQTVHRFLSDDVIAKGTGGEGTTLGNGICSHYELVTNGDSYNKVTGIAITQTGRLSVYDQSKNTMTSSEFKAAMSGVMLYYELATETEITTSENEGWDEYLSIDNFGMLIFYSGSTQVPQVPQAYFIRYTVNPVEFLDSVGEKAGWDADAIALKSDIPIPDAPTADGTYTLKVTISNGTPTYSWVADS